MSRVISPWGLIALHSSFGELSPLRLIAHSFYNILVQNKLYANQFIIIILLLLSPPSLARWLGEVPVGASPGGDGLDMASFSGIQPLLQVVAIGPAGRAQWDVQGIRRDD